MLNEEITKAILSEVSYKDWNFHVGRDQSRLFLQARFLARSAETGEVIMQACRKWLLSPHMTKSELVATAMKAVLSAEEHECRENFRYRGRAIFGPHFDVEKLVMICDEEALDVRAA